jgi:hypothetical protein
VKKKVRAIRERVIIIIIIIVVVYNRCNNHIVESEAKRERKVHNTLSQTSLKSARS